MADLQTGKFIALLRKEKRMTQKELADQLGLSDKAVSKWERGESYPEITLLPRLAEILEVSTDELLAGKRNEITDDASSKTVDSLYISSAAEENAGKSQTPSFIGRRICSLLIDTLLIILILSLVTFLSTLSTPDSVTTPDGGVEVYTGLVSSSWTMLFQFINTWILCIMGGCGLISWLFLWITNGYTPGKWLLGLRVVKQDGSRIGIGTAFLRDFVIKGMAGLLSLNLFTIASFIFMLAGKEKRSLQDMAAHTDVLYVGYEKRSKNRKTA